MREKRKRCCMRKLSELLFLLTVSSVVRMPLCTHDVFSWLKLKCVLCFALYSKLRFLVTYLDRYTLTYAPSLA